jgi:lactate racemase
MIMGKGFENEVIDESTAFDLCAQAFSQKKIDGKKVLFIIPDNTRSGPIDMFFRIVYKLLAQRVKELDFLIALGTHPPMNEEAMYHHLGITKDSHAQSYPKARFFNHESRNPEHLRFIGTVSEDETAEISGGLLHERVDVTIDKKIFDYDLLVIIGPTFPHESMGFSGGHKYFFPGICGEQIVDSFHWMAALVTIPATIGIVDTPMRRLIDKAASFIPVDRMCISLVVKEHDLYGMYIGPPEETFAAAAALSDKIHIVYKDHPFKQVIACAPLMYDELWTAGKCMYKLETVVADGGELIIYAPHVDRLSVVHGADIEKVGFHVRDYFLKQWDKFKDLSGNIRSHSCNVRGIGTYENGIERPRIKVTLATLMNEEYCHKVNLDYRYPASLNPEEWKNREDEGILYVPHAGEILYLLKENPFRK